MSEKSEALIGLIDGYLAKKNHLPANAIKEELKRVKVLEDALEALVKHTLGIYDKNYSDLIDGAYEAARKALGENHV